MPATCLAYDIDIKTITQKDYDFLLYQSQKKDPILASAAAIAFPGLGHNYINDHGTGMFYLISEIASFVAMLTSNSDKGFNKNQYEIAFTSFIVLRLLEVSDVYKKSVEQDDKLKNYYGIQTPKDERSYREARRRSIF